MYNIKCKDKTMKKYRLDFEKYDTHEKINSEYKMKDEIMWDLGHLIVGISRTSDYYIINHYNRSVDLTQYIAVSENYSLNDYMNDWFEFFIINEEKEQSNV